MEPPSFFNLASSIHLDIESFIFAFSIGGVGSIIYEWILNLNHRTRTAKFANKRWSHLFLLIIPAFIFLMLLIFTNLNPIYSASIALFSGATTTMICRNDLVKNTILGGGLFMMLYFIIFILMILIFPNFVNAWNLSAISGILVLGIPIEELIFSFTFGMYWSGIYEFIKQYSLK